MEKKYVIVLSEYDVRKIVMDHLKEKEKMVIPDDSDIKIVDSLEKGHNLEDYESHINPGLLSIIFSQKELEDYMKEKEEVVESNVDEAWSTDECENCPAGTD